GAELHRRALDPTPADLEVQVVLVAVELAGVPGVADGAQPVAGCHVLAVVERDHRQVAVARDDPAAVVDPDPGAEIALAARTARSAVRVADVRDPGTHREDPGLGRRVSVALAGRDHVDAPERVVVGAARVVLRAVHAGFDLQRPPDRVGEPGTGRSGSRFALG